jgi:hypothetical protein
MNRTLASLVSAEQSIPLSGDRRKQSNPTDNTRCIAAMLLGSSAGGVNPYHWPSENPRQRPSGTSILIRLPRGTVD